MKTGVPKESNFIHKVDDKRNKIPNLNIGTLKGKLIDAFSKKINEENDPETKKAITKIENISNGVIENLTGKSVSDLTEEDMIEDG